MKKIRLADGSEYEVYDISDSSGSGPLKISMLNADATVMEGVLKDAERTAVIQYYVGADLIKGYARYTNLSKYEKNMDQLISVDYNTPDETTESGFAEIRADIYSAYLEKAVDTTIADQQATLAADVEELKADMAAINAILEGETAND